MTVWTIAAAALLATLLPAGYRLLRGSIVSRLVGFQFFSTITMLLLLILPTAIGRSDLFDGAVALAMVSIPGTMVFVFVYLRWLSD